MRQMILMILMQELQLNILQQSQLLQAGETAKSSGQLHQLQTKQQQLVAQLQVNYGDVYENNDVDEDGDEYGDEDGDIQDCIAVSLFADILIKFNKCRIRSKSLCCQRRFVKVEMILNVESYLDFWLEQIDCI